MLGVLIGPGRGRCEGKRGREHQRERGSAGNDKTSHHCVSSVWQRLGHPGAPGSSASTLPMRPEGEHRPNVAIPGGSAPIDAAREQTIRGGRRYTVMVVALTTISERRAAPDSLPAGRHHHVIDPLCRRAPPAARGQLDSPRSSTSPARVAATASGTARYRLGSSAARRAPRLDLPPAVTLRRQASSLRGVTHIRVPIHSVERQGPRRIATGSGPGRGGM